MRTRTKPVRTFPHKNLFCYSLEICSHCYPDATRSDFASDVEGNDSRSEDDEDDYNVFGFGGIY